MNNIFIEFLLQVPYYVWTSIVFICLLILLFPYKNETVSVKFISLNSKGFFKDSCKCWDRQTKNKRKSFDPDLFEFNFTTDRDCRDKVKMSIANERVVLVKLEHRLFRKPNVYYVDWL